MDNNQMATAREAMSAALAALKAELDNKGSASVERIHAFVETIIALHGMVKFAPAQ